MLTLTFKFTIKYLIVIVVIFLNTYHKVKQEHLANIRTVVCGAAPLGALDEEKFRQRVGKPVNILQGTNFSIC